jgi:DNA-directed RNA polymerase subunit RPC12/RpoP
MEPMISFRCAACGRGLKVKADKAGRRARCKCGAEVVVPKAEGPQTSPLAEGPPPIHDDNGPIPLSPDEPAPPSVPSTPRLSLDDEPAAKSPSAPTPPIMDADEEEGTYQLVEAFEKPVEEEKPKRGPVKEEEEEEEGKAEGEEEDEALRKKREEEEEALRQRRKRLVSQRKGPEDPAPWRIAQKGLLFLAIAIGIWAGATGIQRLFVFLGALEPSEYASIAENKLVAPDDPPVAGQSRRLYVADFCVGLIAGSHLFTVGKILLIFSISLLLIELIVAAIGFVICLKGPREFGARLLVQTGLVLSGLNFLLILVFQLLPLTGLIRYTLIPYLAPEVAMMAANTERVDPIHIAWGSVPLLDVFLALLFQMLILIQPVLIACYLRAIARALKIESLQQQAEGMIRLGLGTAFAWLAYLLLMNSGSSEVLLMVLRAIYLLGTAFFLGELVWLTMVLLGSRVRIEQVLKVGWVA